MVLQFFFEWILLRQELIIHEGKYIDVIKIGISTTGDFEKIPDSLPTSASIRIGVIVWAAT